MWHNHYIFWDNWIYSSEKLMPQCKNFVMFTKEFTFKNFLRGKIKASKNVLSLSLIMIVCDKQTFFMFPPHLSSHWFVLNREPWPISKKRYNLKVVYYRTTVWYDMLKFCAAFWLALIELWFRDRTIKLTIFSLMRNNFLSSTNL